MSNFIHPLTEINFSQEAFAVGIEASAGTGKTWTIERLFVKALLQKSSEANFNIKRILVVTFTKAAAAELKARILKQIRETILLLIRHKNNKLESSADPFIGEFILKRDSTKLTSDVTVLTRAAQLFDQASIFTIHSFCQQVLKDYPIECKINLPFEIVGNNEEIVRSLVHSFYREEILNNPLFADNLELAVNNLEGLFKADFETSIVDKIYNKLPKDVIDIKDNNYCLKYGYEASDLSLFKSNVPIDKLTGLKTLINCVSNYIFVNYSKYRVLSNNVSFDELIQIVADAVGETPEFATKLYESYPVAFIDEFQDTDIKQWTIFSSIYRLSKNKRGNVVVVGDPKQAIYSFRGADVDTYIQAVHHEIKNTKTLSENRRSHTNIMGFINQLFADENTSQNTNLLGSGISYDEVLACADESRMIGLPAKETLNSIASGKKLDFHFYDQNVQVVSFSREVFEQDNNEDYVLNAMTLEILALLNADPELKGKIAILVTKNYEATKIVNFMRKFGVKASELKLKSVFATTTAQELLNIIEAISDLSNVNKFNIAISGKIFNFELNKLINKELYQNEFESIYSNFFKYQKVFNRNGIMPLIYELISDIAEQNIHLSHRELANLFQLGEILHKNSKKLLNNYELLHWFNKKITDSENIQDNNVENTENEELIRLDNDDDQIVITTQHKSKGLEFEILFCPFFRGEDKYFKKDGGIDGVYINNRMPRYVTHHEEHGVTHKIILGNENNELEHVSIADNAEIQRLNYVALTRAKSRLYIYLTPTKLNSKKTGYHHLSKTAALHKLFGFNPENPRDSEHPLFNYPAIFSNPEKAMNVYLPGVAVYHRHVIREQLKRLTIKSNESQASENKLQLVDKHKFKILSQEQSYTKIAKVAIEDEREYYSEDDTIITEVTSGFEGVKYKYSILNGVKSSTSETISGAKFGLLYHELCENYPLTEHSLSTILKTHNVLLKFTHECKQMIEDAFLLPLLPDGVNLTRIHETGFYQAEFEFNLIIKNQVTFTSQIAQIIAKYYGDDHPYTIASRNLNNIEPGFLKGFIDLLFEHDGKFWVLDYKTNTLESYHVAANASDKDNVLIDAMAHHHYYLQFMLYLVAAKRHLEVIYNLRDASQLLGGAIYMFVRGIYLITTEHVGGILVDDRCVGVVKEVDDLLGNIHE